MNRISRFERWISGGIALFEIFFEKLAHHGLKPGEFTMLWLIGLNPDTRQGDIARRIRIKPAHMTKLVGRAVDAGLVTRIVPERSTTSSLGPSMPTTTA